MHRRRLVLLSLLLLLALPGCGPSKDAAPGDVADLVLLGGRFVTLDADRPEATALAAAGGRIVAIGDDDAVRAWIGAGTEVVELGGAFAMPGFVEGHAHFLGIGRQRMNVDVAGLDSWEAVVERVAAAAAELPAGSWVIGRGWHQDKWSRAPEPAVGGNPVHDALSAATPDHPVALTHASGHALIANARAMALAGIDATTPDPDGGRILRRADGRATGVMLENAEGLVLQAHRRALDAESDEDRRRRFTREIELASESCLAHGITSLHDAGSSFADVDRFVAAAEQDRLGVRLWVMLTEPNASLAERLPGYSVRDAGDHHVTVGGIKRWLDGALGSHGAWLLEPYSDQPTTSGLNTEPLDAMAETARLAALHDLQLCVHAIGDRANRETLDVFERALADAPADRRWRVEHAQHLSREDLGRFAELGVVASMQAVHCTSDGPWVPSRLGAARSEQGAYVWRDLLDSGAVVINGTDAPVESIDPIANFKAAISRVMPDGTAFYPGQAMTREEALAAATRDAAWAAFQEDDLGTLSVGKLADVTVLSQDLLTAPLDTLLDTRVLYTIVGGEIRYRGEGAGGSR